MSTKMTKADLRRAAKMRAKGATWNAIREALGVKTQSGQFQVLWAREGIDALPSRDLGTAKRLQSLRENREAREAAEAK